MVHKELLGSRAPRVTRETRVHLGIAHALMVYQVPKVQLDLWDPWDLKDQQDHRESRVHKDPLVLQGHVDQRVAMAQRGSRAQRDCKVHKETREHRVHKALWVPLDRKVIKVYKDLLDPWVPLDHKDHRAYRG